MAKTYLISTPLTTDELKNIKKGDIIDFEMPPFCSGDYSEIVDEDERGLFIPDSWFDGCRSYSINPTTPTWQR